MTEPAHGITAASSDLACANTPASSANSSRRSSPSHTPSPTMGPTATSLFRCLTHHGREVAVTLRQDRAADTGHCQPGIDSQRGPDVTRHAPVDAACI
jgi:hypothetical protein